MVETTQTNDDYIWIFCFGSNGPKQLCERIGSNYEDLVSRTLPAVAKGWLRGFKATSATWSGKSVATIWQTGNEDDAVCGTVVKMTNQEVERLDPFEGHPFKYKRQVVKLTAFKVGEPDEGFELECQAYIILDKEDYNVFVDPSDAYK